MFTPVDSNRKKIDEHLPGKNVHHSHSEDNSFINKIKLVFASQFQKLFSKNDEYIKLQITIFGITFIVAILVASITGIIFGYTFGFSVFTGAIAGIFYLRLLAKRHLPMIDSVGLYTYLNLYRGGFLNYVHISGLK